MHMHTFVTCLHPSPWPHKYAPARPLQPGLGVDLDPEQPYRRPLIRPGQGAVGGHHGGIYHPQEDTYIALSTVRRRRFMDLQ